MKRLALLLVFAATPAAAVPASQLISPGYWESTNRLISPIKQTSTEKRCLKAADVDRFIGGQLNRHYKCAYPTNVIANGQIRLKGVCVSKKGHKVPVDAHGTYTPTSFTLTADAVVEFLGLDVSVRASTEAHRIGDTCPAPEALPQPQADK